MAYYFYEAYSNDKPTSAVYRTCVADCEVGSNWQEVRLLDKVNEVQLALTPNGKPRMLIRADRDLYDGQEYYYAVL